MGKKTENKSAIRSFRSIALKIIQEVERRDADLVVLKPIQDVAGLPKSAKITYNDKPIIHSAFYIPKAIQRVVHAIRNGTRLVGVRCLGEDKYVAWWISANGRWTAGRRKKKNKSDMKRKTG